MDEAKITADGAVAGGNKIKIGTPIVLEGYNYRTGGTISNVQVLTDKDVFIINEQLRQIKAAESKEAKAIENNTEDKTQQSQKTQIKKKVLNNYD